MVPETKNTCEQVFGKRLKELRKEHGCTIEQFADMVGISKSTLGYYENDKRMPDIEILARIANVLKVPDDIRIASLYDGEALLDCTPQITAVSFDPELLGKRAAQQLLAVTRRQPVETGALLGYQVGLRTSTQT